MELKENLGLILIIIGLLICMTMYLAWIGVPIAAIGTYMLYKKVSKQEEKVAEELQTKKDEINGLDKELEQLKADLALAREEEDIQTY